MNRYFAITDIHGCSKTLSALINEKLCPLPNDTLIFLGDYVNKGPDSKAVLDQLIEFEKGDWETIFLRGNHDQLLLESISPGFVGPEYFEQSLASTLKSFGVDQAADIPTLYLDFLRRSIFYFQTEQFMFVHAGLNFDLDNPLEDTDAMLYLRSMSPKPEKIGKRTIIHGHVPRKLAEIEKDIAQKGLPAYCLDAGCPYPHKGMGDLVALELGHWKLYVQKNIDT
ncbi:MAG: metallophosphoesterase [Cyclobacteriaceae bacterium]